MTSLDRADGPSGQFHGLGPAHILLRTAPALYAMTLFSSALLLFAIQPMFTKLVLPRLGGAPAVWSVAMVFFQVVLLAGYAYAHLLMRTLAPARAALAHLALMAAAAATLPIAVASGFGAAPVEGTALWLFGLFAASIGLPFFVLSASAPLLQGWFAASGHPRAGNPYVLYAASNLGSFTGLLAYPIVVEPLLSLKLQSELWSAAYGGLAVLMAVTALTVARAAAVVAAPATAADEASPPTTRERLRWIALAMAPSGLVVAVTAHLTTDIVAAPFLWVVPLALYLLTFVATFRERQWIAHDTVVWFAPFVVAPLAVSVLGGDRLFWGAMMVLNVAGFVILTLVCHGELYARRPASRRLTEFYLWISLGGAIGGAFAGLIAPNLFNGTYEYPILILAALLLSPGAFAQPLRRLFAEAWPVLALTAALVLAYVIGSFRLPEDAKPYYHIALVVLVACMLFQRNRPARFAALVVCAFVLTELWRPGMGPVETARSFFGVHRVVDVTGGAARLLYHGTTIHGAERLRDRGVPVAYYYFGGPISEGIAAARAAHGGLDRVAVVGLGAGSLACHRQGREAWTFYEIDPEVARIARTPSLFSFLASCAPDAEIVLGDARVTLAASPHRYDLIVLDAFSSDSIPVHLLTREALAGYLSRLTPNGVMVIHISNRHMDLAAAVAAVAAAEGLATWIKTDDQAGDFFKTFQMKARVVAVARDPAHVGDLPSRAGWHRLLPEPHVAAWTDDYSNILGAIWRQKVGRPQR